jgi:hypothetical protein
MIHSGKFIFIRFNPDNFINSNGTKKNNSISSRMIYLENEINNQIDRINNEQNDELIELVYLFYNNF